VDRGGDYADAHNRRPDGGAVYRRQSSRNGYYTYKQRKFAIWTFLLDYWLMGLNDCNRDLHTRPWLDVVLARQTWDAQRVEFAVNRNVDQIFGINGSWLVHLMPSGNASYAPILARIIFGIFPDLVLFIVAGYLVHRMLLLTDFSKRIFNRMTLLQMATMELFLVLMLSLPVKILLRLLLRIKYVWVTPWFSI